VTLVLTCVQGDLKNRIADCGGAFVSKVTSECTYLVANQKQYDAQGAKGEQYINGPCNRFFPNPGHPPLRQHLISVVTQAKNNAAVKIVSYDWLVKSLGAKKKVSDSSFTLGADNAATTTTTTATADSTVKESKTSKGRKRKRADPSDDEDDAIMDSAPQTQKQTAKQGSAAKKAPVNVPVDDWCHLKGSHSVYQADDGTVYDVTLNQTNAGQNNNKFYRIQLLESVNKKNYRTWTRWGRVGEGGQNAMLGSGSLTEALSQFEKKFKDKTGHKWDSRHEPAKKGKYTYIERNYEESDEDSQNDLPGAGTRRSSKQSLESDEISNVESKLPTAVQNLISFIFNTEMFNQTMASMDYDAHKMPLGKLSKRTLTQGYQILKDIAALIGDHSLAQSEYGQSWEDALEDLSNRYFSTIPHSFGRNRPPVIQDDRLMKKEIDLIESLTDMQLANEIMKTAKGAKEKKDVHLIDRQYDGLGMQEMTPLSSSSNEFKNLQDYLIKSAGKTHSIRYKVQDIFRIERQGEKERFVKSPYAAIKNSDRRLLWHGSRSTNFGGILSQGLRIAPPEAPVSGMDMLLLLP
jgi:poly [ADP-ribose] polymerase 2/3/4